MSLILEGITCPACVWLNETHLARQPGIVAVSINFTTNRALATMGYVTPWMAAIGMSASSLLVVRNALRLSRRPRIHKVIMVPD